MTNKTKSSFRFLRRLNDGSTYVLGWATEYPQGWRFVSNVASHRSSRTFHPTMEKCVPRWVADTKVEEVE